VLARIQREAAATRLLSLRLGRWN